MIDFLPIDRMYSVFGLSIPIWGTMAALSILLFTIIYFHQARKYLLNETHAFHTLAHFAFWGLLGFHLYKIFFVEHRPDMIIQYGKVGLDSFGAILGFIAVFVYLKIKKLNMSKYLDAIALPLIVAATTQRISDALINDKVGAIATLPWSVMYYAQPRHPIGLYYLTVSIIILVIVLLIARKNLRPGNLMLSTALMYCFTRFFLDFYREYPQHIYHGLSVHQVAYGLAFLALLITYIIRNELIRKARYLKKALFTIIVSLLFPKGRGKDFLKIYIYFRYVDNIIDNKRISKESRILFLKKQYRFIDSIYADIIYNRWQLPFEKRGIYDVILKTIDYGGKLRKHIYELMSTFDYDIEREGSYISEKGFMSYSRKIGDCYAYAFMMLFDTCKYEKKWDSEFVKMTGKTLYGKVCDYAHYAHLLHTIKDSKSDDKRGIHSYPKGKKKEFFGRLLKIVRKEFQYIDHNVFDAITNPLLRFATWLYYWRFKRILMKQESKYNI